MTTHIAHAPATKPSPAIGVLWEEGQRRLLAQSERLARLDSKTTPLLGFGIAAAVFFQTNAGRIGAEPARLGTALAVLGILCTLGVMYPRIFSYAPIFKTFLSDGNRTPDKLKELYLGNVRTAIAENDAALEIKTLWFKLAIWLYVATTAAAVGTIIGTRA